MSPTRKDIPHGKWGVFEFTVFYPFSNSRSKYRSFILGHVFSLSSFLLIPYLTLLGYMTRLLEYAATGEKEAPRYSGFNELTTEGALALVALSPLYIVFVASLILVTEVSNAFFILTGAVWYVYPAYHATYAVERNVTGLYTSKQPLETSYSANYLFAHIVFSIVTSVFLLLSQFLTIALLMILIFPILLYIPMSYWGYVYYKEK